MRAGRDISLAHYVRSHENLRVFVGFPPQEKTSVFSLSRSNPALKYNKNIQQTLDIFIMLRIVDVIRTVIQRQEEYIYIPDLRK